MESVWFLFWWFPLLSVDGFQSLWVVLSLSSTPSQESQAGWDLGDKMARSYRFDTKWVCFMGREVMPEVFKCSVGEIRWRFISRIDPLNTSGITSHGTDSFRVKLVIPGYPILKISTHLTIFWGGTCKIEFMKTIYRQERTSSEKKSDGFHTKCSIELWTILMFELLLYCHTAAWCMEQT